MIYVIAFIEGVKRKTKERYIKQVRLFGTDYRNYRDVDTVQFVNSLINGIKVENIKFIGGELKAVNFDIKRLPTIKTNGIVDRSYLKTIMPLDNGYYLAVDYDGSYQLCTPKEILRLVRRMDVINPSYYTPVGEELSRKERIIEVLKNCGCTDILVNDLYEIEKVVIPNNCDLLIPAEVTRIKRNALIIGTNVLNSITIEGSLENDTIGYESAFDCGSAQLKVNKVIIKKYAELRGFLEIAKGKPAELVIDYEIQNYPYETIRYLSGYISNINCISNLMNKYGVKLSYNRPNRLDVNNFVRVTDALKEIFNMRHGFDCIENIKDRVGVNGYSPAQANTILFIQYVDCLFTPALKERLLKEVEEYNFTPEYLIDKVASVRYPKYRGAMLQRKEVLISCYKPIMSKKDPYGYNTKVHYFDSRTMSRKETTVAKLGTTNLDINDIYSDSNYILVGIDKSITNDTLYGVIEIKYNERRTSSKTKSGSNMMYSGFKHMTIAEVVDILSKEPGMYNGKMINLGNYVIISSLCDICLFDYNVVRDIIEANQPEQLGRLKNINSLLGKELDYEITDLGVLTLCSYDKRVINIPNGVKEVGYKAIRASYINVLSIPKDMKPLTKNCFMDSDTYIRELIVNDCNNAICGLQMKQSLNGKCGVDKMIYKVHSQEDLYKFLCKVWNKDIFIYGPDIELSQTLDMEYTQKLLAYIMTKSGYMECIRLKEEREYTYDYYIPSKYTDSLKAFKKFLYYCDKYVDAGIVNAIKATMDLGILYDAE